MHSWTSQSGFPIVHVSVKNDHLRLEQQRFVANPSSPARNDETLWPVPVLAKGMQDKLASKKVTNIPFSNKPPLLINDGQYGFYRVDYSSEIQKTIIDKFDTLTDTDRMSLLADGFEVTRAGYDPVDEYLALLSEYSNETSLPVWEIVSGSIGSIRAVLSSSDENDDLRDAMKPFILKLTEKQLKRLGTSENKDESHLDTLLRPIIVSLSASADHPEVVDYLLQTYRDRVDNGTEIYPNIRGTVFSTAARKGGMKEFEEMRKLYNETPSIDEKLSLTAGITSFEQPEIHQKVFEMLKSDDVKLQDYTYWVAYSFMNRHSRKAAWEFMKENWQWFNEEIGSDLAFSRLPVYAARSFADEELLKDFEEFFTTNMEPKIERSYNQGLEVGQTAAAWRKRDSKTALEYFKKNN